MSDQPAEGTQVEEGLDLVSPGATSFGDIMDALAPEGDAPEGGAGEASTDAPAGGDGQDPAPAEGDRGDEGAAAAETPGDGGEPAVPGDGDGEQPAAGEQPGAGEASAGVGTVEATSLAPKWTEISEALEKNHARGHQDNAMKEVREEYPKYFEALERHPRELVGMEVPKVNGQQGMEVLRDADDAKQWQEATKNLLVREVRDRAGRFIESDRESMQVLHSSIGLFQKNPDLIPRTKEFNATLANRFAELAKDYEVRVDGKLKGYAIDVQPLINQVRATMAAEKQPPAAQPKQQTTAATTTPAATAPAAKPKTPQAGLQSKAGGSAEDKEDFSTFFGTAGLPNIRI